METQSDKRFTGGILCKISKMVFLQELQRGSVYMNRLDFYTKTENQENGEGFLDQEEGLVCKDVNITFGCNGSKFVFQNVSGRMGMATPVFCCSILKIPDLQDGERKEFYLDSRLIRDFSNGDRNEYGVLLISQTEFCHRLQYVVAQQGLIYYMGNVRYEKFENSPANINNFPIAIFRKDPKFSYQNEYRIAIQKSIQKPFRLEIGDISDISFLCDLDILKHPIFAHIEK
jgi:hypothetical protein